MQILKLPLHYTERELYINITLYSEMIQGLEEWLSQNDLESVGRTRSLPEENEPERKGGDGARGKGPAASAGGGRGTGSVPGSGRSLGGGHGNPLQYFAWRIPWTEEPGRLWSTGPQRVEH